MRDYLKEYVVELETVGPLFIGSGRELNKKEYLLMNDEIMVMDIPRLFSLMKENGLIEEFESFFLDNTKKDLFWFFKKNGVDFDEVEACIRYRLVQSDTSLERGTTATVMEFVKDPYGLPYIPGSSIKGMLRTILLADDIVSNQNRYEAEKTQLETALQHGGKRNSLLRREAKNLEVTAFNKLNRNEKKKADAVNDVLSGLIVSDSKPLSINDMVLCQRVEYHVDGLEKSLNVLRECIKPATKVNFKLTIDSSVCPYTREDIMNAIERFSSIYSDSFTNGFSGVAPGEPDSVYLGGGVGFVSKTIVYPLFGHQDGLDMTVDIFDATKVPRIHKHRFDREDGVSPHVLKMTRYEGRLYQMGECRWKFL